MRTILHKKPREPRWSLQRYICKGFLLVLAMVPLWGGASLAYAQNDTAQQGRLAGIGDTLRDTWDRLQEYLPNILLSLAVLIVGTILARILAGVVHWILAKLSLCKRMRSWMSDNQAAAEAPPHDGARWIAAAVFCILELFVVIAFFHVLKFPPAEENLNRILAHIFEYLPRLLGALLILLVAWIVASILRFIVTRALGMAKLDQRLARGEPPAEGAAPAETWSLTKTLAQTAYWLVFILVLPAVFDALAIEGLRNPMSGMLDKILAYLPNVFLAGIILVVGWFVARTVQRILANLLAAIGLNRLSERIGLTKALGGKTLADLIALVVYILILIPVVIAALNALQVESITQPASAMLSRFLDAIPRLFGAALVMVVAYIVGRLLSQLTASLLESIGLDHIPARLGLGQPPTDEKKASLSKACGYIVLVVVMLLAALAALQQLGFVELAAVLRRFLDFLGDVVLALVVFGLGLFLADLAYRTIRAGRFSFAISLALVARIAIIVLAAAMALQRIGVGENIVLAAFIAIIGMVTVAAAIAFGIGGRDLAKRRLEEWDQKLRGKP